MIRSLWMSSLINYAQVCHRNVGRSRKRVSFSRFMRNQHDYDLSTLERLEPRLVLTMPAGDTMSTALSVTPMSGATWECYGSIGDESTTYMGMPASDVDLFQTQLSAGQTLIADVDAQETPSGTPLSNLDGYLRIFDVNGTELAHNDNSLGADPFISFTAMSSGTYYIGVSGAPDTAYDPHSVSFGSTASTGDYDLKLGFGSGAGTGSSSGSSSGSGSGSSSGSGSGSSSGSGSGSSSGSGSGSSSGSGSGSSSGSGTTGGGGGGVGFFQNADGSYTLHPGYTLSLPNCAPVTNSSADPDGINGPIGDVYVWPSQSAAGISPVQGSDFTIFVDGNGSWTSGVDIGSLTFTTTGGMGVSPINGNLLLSAGTRIADLSAHKITAQSGSGGIGRVVATDVVSLETGGDIDSVTCDSDALFIVGHELGPVHVKGNANWVQGILSSGITVDKNLLHLDCVSGTKIDVKGNAGSIQVMGPLNELDIGGDATDIRFSSCDMAKTVSITGSLGLIQYDSTSGNWVPFYSQYSGLHVYYASIPADSTLTANGINLIEVQDDLCGTITSGGRMNVITVGGQIDNANIKAVGNMNSIAAGTSISGDIESQNGFLGGIVAGTSLSGTVKVAGDLGSVWAGTTLNATVTSSDGTITFVSAGEDLAGSISAGASIGDIVSDQSIDASIIASSGSIGNVTADMSIGGTIAAGTTIKQIKATNGEIEASTINAGGNITALWAKLGIGGSSCVNIQAGGSITSIMTVLGDINATVDSQGSVSSVSAPVGDLNGSLTAAINIGDVTVGGNIQSDVIATSGNIDSVVAGMDHPGNITGQIRAGRSIGAVVAGSTLSYPSDWNDSSASNMTPTPIDTGTLINLMTSGGTYNSLIPKPDVPTSTAGNISGVIIAGRNIGEVQADGTISDTIQAGLSLANVFAIGDISGSIATGAGGITVESWGALSSSITAVGSVAADAVGALSGAITSSQGGVSASSWDQLSSTIDSESTVTVWGYASVAGSIVSHLAGIELVSLGSATVNLQSWTDQEVNVEGLINGNLLTDSGSIYLGAGSIGAGVSIAALRDLIIYSFSTISANVGTGFLTPNNVTITTWGSYTGTCKA
ncbi:MAG: putative pre-peptidase, partial [Planctomycetaceae bacterium]|nr:putative pre-peptidase [Planctomycetaceae bacterium]